MMSLKMSNRGYFISLKTLLIKNGIRMKNNANDTWMTSAHSEINKNRFITYT